MVNSGNKCLVAPSFKWEKGSKVYMWDRPEHTKTTDRLLVVVLPPPLLNQEKNHNHWRVLWSRNLWRGDCGYPSDRNKDQNHPENKHLDRYTRFSRGGRNTILRSLLPCLDVERPNVKSGHDFFNTFSARLFPKMIKKSLKKSKISNFAAAFKIYCQHGHFQSFL